MEYSINELARLAGISVRTLHHYDEIGLLSPQRRSNNYRVYGQKEVDLLQQLLFYRELGVPLKRIRKIVQSTDYDRLSELCAHLAALKSKREKLDALILNIEKTIAVARGIGTMTDEEKFAGLKQRLIKENEVTYGKEVRERFGDEAVDDSNTRILGMSQDTYDKTQRLSEMINESLLHAFKEGDPSSPLAQEVCALHKEWLKLYWNTYSKEAHLAMAQTYVDDSRFKAYYDSLADGCAEFLRDAVKIYCA